MKRKIICLLSSIIFLLSSLMPASCLMSYAAESYSLQILYENAPEKISGADFKIKKVSTFPFEAWDDASITIPVENAFTDMDAVAQSLKDKYKDDATIVAQTTDEAGITLFSDLEPGMYLVWQTDRKLIAESYQEAVPFLVNLSSSNPDLRSMSTLTVRPKAVKEKGKGIVEVYTNDDKGNILAGAEFKIYKKDTNEEIATLTSTNTPPSIYEGLAYGEYYLKNTKPPAGYDLITTLQYFTITKERPVVQIYIVYSKKTEIKTETKTKTVPTPVVVEKEVPTATPAPAPSEPAPAPSDPAIFKTLATCNGQKFVAKPSGGGTVTINDKVTYNGFGNQGSDYNLTGYIIDKATGQPVVDHDGNMFVSVVNFKHNKSGEVNVAIAVDSTCLKNGQEIVVYEIMRDTAGNVITTHTDIHDADQTLMVKGFDPVQTGIFPILGRIFSK